MKINHFLFSVLMTITFKSAMASEADGFTNRYEPLADSSGIINARANKYFTKALSDLNAKSSDCNESALYQELRIYFENHINGVLVKEIMNDEAIPKRPTTIETSIYKDWTPWDGIGMGVRFVSKKGSTIAPLLHFGNELIGADKFEHFFGQGFAYFSENYLQRKGMEKAVKTGILKEKIFLGGNKFGNGVFSYGDLSANFNGMRFWNHILQKNDDVLGVEHNLGPYVACENNKWIRIKELDFRDYMDSAMDESINCSKFPTKDTADKFTRAVHRLGMTCPLDPKKIDELVLKYGAVSKWIINKDGTGALNYIGEFKHKK